MKASRLPTLRFPTWGTWRESSASNAGRALERSRARIGIPKVLSVWSTHQFWVGLLRALGLSSRNIVFSSDTSETQFRRYAEGRVVVETCYPVKCMAGHIGELLLGQRRPLDAILCPMIYTLPSFLAGHVTDTFACSRDVAAVETMKAAFLAGDDLFANRGVKLLTPLVSLGEPRVAVRQLGETLRAPLQVDERDLARAVEAGYESLGSFEAAMRRRSLEILRACARDAAPCILVLARPYHMDPGIGHGIVETLQQAGYPVLWNQYLPLADDLLSWLFESDLREGHISHPLEIHDVWRASYSNSTNEILWGAKFAARCPWITCVVRLSSYECGMDQPTFTPVQRIVEASDTLYFKFGDLDATKPAGSVAIRIETVLHYLGARSRAIIEVKRARLSSPSPLSEVRSYRPTTTGPRGASTARSETGPGRQSQ